MLIAGCCLVPVYLPGLNLHQLDATGWAAMGFLIVIGTALTFSLFLRGAFLTGSQNASILSCAEPLSSTILSVLLLGVSFGVAEWVGSLLIILSVIFITLAPDRLRTKTKITAL